MAVLRVGPLPGEAGAAAARFYAEVLPLINPPPKGEGDHPQDGGGAQAGCVDPAKSRHAEGAPPPSLRDGPPPPSEEDLTLIFPPADHTHRGWRLAAVQSLAREFAPIRVNAVTSDSEAAIAAALAFLGSAEGITGQLLELDDTGAGEVVSSTA